MYQAISRNDLRIESVGASSTITNSSPANPAVTNSFDLNPATSTLHSAPTEQQAPHDTEFATNGATGHTKLITKGPPSYSSLYHSYTVKNGVLQVMFIFKYPWGITTLLP